MQMHTKLLEKATRLTCCFFFYFNMVLSTVSTFLLPIRLMCGVCGSTNLHKYFTDSLKLLSIIKRLSLINF